MDDGQSTSIDGLGDRNRSLSPEGDNAWDTLLSTVTPVSYTHLTLPTKA